MSNRPKRPSLEEIRNIERRMHVGEDSWGKIASATEADLRRKGLTLDIGVEPGIKELKSYGSDISDLSPVPLERSNNNRDSFQYSHEHQQKNASSGDEIDYALDIAEEIIRTASNIIKARVGNRSDLRSIVRDALENEMYEFLNSL